VQPAYHSLPTCQENLLVIAIAGNGQMIATEIGEDGAANAGGAAGIGMRASKFWPS
jgi:hypothetical protein